MKTEANTRPDNRDVKQARLKKREAMALFKRRLAKLSKTDMLSYKKDKQAEALGNEYVKMVRPFLRILREGDDKALKREVAQIMSDRGYSSGRSTNSDNKTRNAESRMNSSAADSPGKGSDEPITKKNKGGLAKKTKGFKHGGLAGTGHNDMRKGGLFK